MTRRRPLIAGNWKMHQTVASSGTLVVEILAAIPPQAYDEVDVVLCPPFTALAGVALAIEGTGLQLGAQNVSAFDWGPYTGQISAPMLLEFGTRYVIIGHSEVRTQCGETDAGCSAKLRAALQSGMTPILAVGETLAEHEGGLTRQIVGAQVRQAFEGVSAVDAERCVIAYEPIWAIGSGRSDTPEDAAAVIAEIRTLVPGLDRARCLYGGSMKPANAEALLAQPEIDGGLIGGASLDAAAFALLVNLARKAIATR
ncbi:MAG: triose-phosphate isomerase [bacterium]|nr:triose-phosphate isomerase [bacterium]